MELDKLDNLELQVEKLIKKYLDLMEENSILRKRLKYNGRVFDNPELENINELKTNNEKLQEKNSKAIARLKTLLEKLDIDSTEL